MNKYLNLRKKRFTLLELSPSATKMKLPFEAKLRVYFKDNWEKTEKTYEQEKFFREDRGLELFYFDLDDYSIQLSVHLFPGSSWFPTQKLMTLNFECGKLVVKSTVFMN